MVMGAIFAAALSFPAFAMTLSLPNDGMLVISPAGVATSVRVTEAPMTDVAMKNSRVAPGAVILMKHGGKLYVVDDVTLENGQTLSQRLIGGRHTGGTGSK